MLFSSGALFMLQLVRKFQTNLSMYAVTLISLRQLENILLSMGSLLWYGWILYESCAILLLLWIHPQLMNLVATLLPANEETLVGASISQPNLSLVCHEKHRQPR